MKKAKRALALALVFALVASFCVTGAAAAPGDGPTQDVPSSYVQNGQTVTTEDRVAVSKTATRTGENAYNITLEVTVPGDVTVPGSSADVVLVIDRSGSMGDGGKMAAAKEAAKAFADALLKDGNDVKMAVVSYADNVSTDQVLTNSAGDVKGAVDGIRANGGTHIQAGIHAAREILEGSKADKQVIVVLSDGEPTYSFRSIGTGTYSHDSWGLVVEHELVEGSVKVTGFDYHDSVGNGSSYSLITDWGILGEYNAGYSNITVTCEECDHVGTETVSYYENNGDPTIAEADFARKDGYEVYGLYLGTPNENAQHTMQGVADSGKYQQADTDSLNGLLQDIAGDVTETTAGAVTDPMGENIQLGSVSGLSGVSVEGNTLYWNPTQSQGQPVEGGTKYTVTYPITVKGEALDESCWLDANGRTTFSYEVNGVDKTVEFNVPQVWGEKVETETEQDVYVYVQVVDKYGNALGEAELAKVREWGLTTLNKDGYFTIGKVQGCMLPATDAYEAGTNIIGNYRNAVNINSIVRHEDNKAFTLDGVEWYTLHTANGATDYSEVSSDTLCWHMDGKITLEQLEQRLVTVTYNANADDATGTTEAQSVIKGFGVTLRENGFTNPGYTFTGWNTQADGSGTGYTAREQISALNENLTLYAQWSRNADEVYIKVYLDGADNDVTEQYETYLSGLTTTGTTTGIGEIAYENGHVVVPYTYDDINAADVQFGVSSGYVLQGVSGTFVFGSSGWGGSTGQGVAISGSTWTVDNVDGKTTLKIYVNTKYSVKYEVPFGTAPTDGNTYITVEGVGTANTPVFPADIDPNQGVEGSWKNTDATIKTQITLATLPTGTTGWYDKNDASVTSPVIVAENTNLANDDNVFVFTAKANTYTVTYHANNGATPEATYVVENVTHSSSHTVLGNDTTGFTRPGYSFDGWTYDAEGEVPVTSSITVTGNVDLYAQWTADEDTAYKVEHYQEQLDGAFVLHETEELTGTTGDTATATPKSYTGFTFDAGNEDNVTSGTIAGDGSLVLKLYYVRNTYTVTYNANGGSGTMNDENSPYKYGATVTVKDNGFTRENYEFTGWAFDAEGDEPAGETFTITENTTLYAQWEEITGTLTVTKTFSGLDEDVLPDDFKITVTGPNGYSKELTLNDADDGNTYTWTIEGLLLGEYTVTETNYAVEGYLCEGDGPETATISDAEGESVTLTNSYTAISRELVVGKSVVSVGGVDVTDTVPEAKVGDTIIYKIVVTNNSNVALENISVTDTLGGESLTVYTDATCETEATAFDLAVDETKELYATYTVEKADAGSTLTNTATATDGDTTDDGEVTVEVKKQYTLTVEYYYDEASGEPFETEEYTLNEGDSWSVSTETGATHVAPETVRDDEYVQFVLDTELPIASGADGIKTDVVVELVYARDEWEDGTPDYKQAWIVYEVADGQDEMGDVDPTSEVVTLEEVDGEYKKTVTADSTATPAAGNVFVNWTHEDNEVSSSAGLDYDFTAEGGRIYVFTAHFRAGTTSASVDKQLVSYERDGETVSEIPEGFKALVGDVLNYEISVENTGEVALNDIAVSDTLWGNGVDSAMVGGAETDVSSGSCTVNVAVDGSVVITYSYTVTADDAGETITNTATADLPGDEPGGDPTVEEEVTVDEYGITVTPADITIYMGGDDGYEAVVGENGQVISDNNTLPTPLFTVELSESFGELSVEQIEAIEIAGTTSDEVTRGWRFDYAGETEDGENLYYIVPDEGQDPIRVTYTNDADEEVVSDHFDPATIDELFAEFTIKLYTGTVTSVTAEVKGITCEIDYDGTGTLTVRAVDDTDENPVVGVQVALPRPVEAGEGAVTAPAGTTYALNETTVAADAAGVGLLFDGIIDDGADRTGALLAELESELGVTVEDGNYQAQYLDLVDAHNGNAWVKASGAVTVYWGYPAGTGEDTDFALYHFEGLHREGANSGFDIEDVATSDIERVTITKTANGIAFDISRGGFSPFVLVWDDGDGGDEPWWPPIGPGDDDDDGDDGGDGEFVPKWLNIDDHYAYIIGYEDGTVRPQGNITRAEVATIFFRLLTDEVRAEYWSTVSGYTDVKAGDWYNNAISTLSDLGIITGYEDGTFRPNASISRAEFVTIATRFFDYAAEYEGAFSDVSYSSWYADFVQAAVDMGLVNGYENGTFRPNASITRAEAVAIVNRVLLRRPDADHLLPWSVMNTFSDNVLESAWYYADIQEATNSHDYEWLKSGVEDWTEKLPERDWAALEREWSKAYDAPGGEVTA